MTLDTGTTPTKGSMRLPLWLFPFVAVVGGPRGVR